VAPTEETLRLARDVTVTLNAIVDSRTRALVKSWARAWDVLTPLFAGAVAELVVLGEGSWPKPSQVLRANQTVHALEMARAELETLGREAGVGIAGDIAKAVTLAADAQAKLVASQLPGTVDRDALAATLRQPDQAALDWIVRRTSGQVTAIHYPLASDATEQMKRSLVKGVAVGDNPRVAAREMVRRTESDFNGGLQRAFVISRTETIDAHRAAATVTQNAMSDMVTGWTWLATLDQRTCPSCWAMHGSEHPLDEPGPLDHQQGRCSRTPITKSWRDLGFDIDEPPSVIPDAQTVFNALPRDQQLAIMGPGRLAALDNGQATWADLPMRRSTDGWRDSFVPTPVSALTR